MTSVTLTVIFAAIMRDASLAAEMSGRDDYT